eukprot:12662318-Alexandrium_andersonii.AAC.1
MCIRDSLWPVRSWPIRSTSKLSAISSSSTTRSCPTAWAGARDGTQRDWCPPRQAPACRRRWASCGSACAGPCGN